MNANYVAVTFSEVKGSDTDVIIALLADAGFEGFEEIETSVKAYISKEEWSEEEAAAVAKQFSLAYSYEELASQNWNAVWESNFEPVIIDDFVAVRAHFHEPVSDVKHDIIITPKMSFGTGHHATTTMMIQQMRDIDFTNKTGFDFGTGTGILAILAEKLGAKEVIAIDNDEWSIENSRENMERNHCSRIHLLLRNDGDVKGSFDIILANINRNVILDNMAVLASQLHPGGFLLLSGLLTEDESVILDAITLYYLQHCNTVQSKQWISLLLSR